VYLYAIDPALPYVMALFQRIDRWIGRTIFVPAISEFCLRTRQTSNAVYRLFWFAATLDGLYRADTPFFIVLYTALSAYMMVNASLNADRKTGSFLIMRILALEGFISLFMHGAMSGTWSGVEFWFLVLVAEYAATISLPSRGDRSASEHE
jgi:hypothetical protein